LSGKSDLLTVDQKLLHETYDKWPEHFKIAGTLMGKIDKDPSFYNSVLFCGMGGSATGCDILNDLMQHNGTVFSTVAKGNDIPRSINSRSLVIANSVSGNTEEVLTMVTEATDLKAEVICISSGGKLKDIALSYGHKHILIPDLSLPRAALPYLIMPGLKLILPFLNDFDYYKISVIADKVRAVARQISVNVSEEDNVAKRIANFLKNGFVFCLTSPYLISAGTRFKNSLNENAKLHCTKETILESTHNEIVPFTFRSNAFARKVVFRKGEKDTPLIKRRFKKVQNFFSEIGQPYIDLTSVENDMIAALICSIYILDYATIYTAVERGLDPSPTPAIDILKRI
jgi:glucose/mannose-6-phosphate isomerase